MNFQNTFWYQSPFDWPSAVSSREEYFWVSPPQPPAGPSSRLLSWPSRPPSWPASVSSRQESGCQWRLRLEPGWAARICLNLTFSYKRGRHLTWSTKLSTEYCLDSLLKISFSLRSSDLARSTRHFLMPVMSLDRFSSAMRSFFCDWKSSADRSKFVLLRISQHWDIKIEFWAKCCFFLFLYKLIDGWRQNCIEIWKAQSFKNPYVNKEIINYRPEFSQQ